MDGTLLTFIISLDVVLLVCLFVAIHKQSKVKETSPARSVSGADNHKMNTEKYTGQYTAKTKTGVANELF